jgi:hypothetical protein
VKMTRKKQNMPMISLRISLYRVAGCLLRVASCENQASGIYQLFNWFDWFNSFNWFSLCQQMKPIKQIKLTEQIR